MLSGSTPATKLSVDQLLDRFAKTPRQRRPLIKQIEARAKELAAVGPELLSGFISLVMTGLPVGFCRCCIAASLRPLPV